MKTILFAGASGNIAQSAIRNLKGSGFLVRAGVRKSSIENAKKIYANLDYVEVVELDTHKPETLEDAFKNVEYLYFATLLAVPGVFEKVYVDAAKKVGTVKHIIHSTGSTADVPEVFPVCSEFIFEREAFTKNSEISWTILHPLMFMQNIATTFGESIISNNSWEEPVLEDAKIAFVDVEDIGKVVASIFKESEKHIEKTYTIAGPEAISNKEVAQILTDELGKEITFNPIKTEEWVSSNWGGVTVEEDTFSKWLFDVLRENYSGFSQGAEGENLLNSNIEDITGVSSRSFRDYIKANKNKWIK